MRGLVFALLVVLNLSLSARPAQAGAVFAAIGAFFTSGSIIAQVIGRILISVAASALMQALAPKPKTPGIRTEVAQNGGINPCSFVLMSYATAGKRNNPPMSHGTAGKTPNAYLTEVIELGFIPGQALSGVIINGERVTLGGAHPDYGPTVNSGIYTGHAWVKYYNGSQTVADPMLLAKYGSYPERPWSADMVGTGLCYAIVTFLFNREKYNAFPTVLFEVVGIPLYDPRKDTTVGGSGAHRWANKATWEPTTNPVVAIYNILRGIETPEGFVWGGGIPAEDLPLASWFAAMNACDVLVDNGAGGTERQYRAGFEVSVDDEPADIIAELLKACSGQIAEVGGIWKIRVGGPGLSVLSITDGDILTTEARDLTPFPGFTSSFNGVTASYPEPGMLWEPKEAPPLYNATWEAEDQGQRLVADLAFPTVPYGAQVRRLMEAMIREERRFLRHGHTLPPDAAILEPLDAIAWTSSANGYSAKVFEVGEVVDQVFTVQQTIALRERDPADYVSSAPTPPAFASRAVVQPPPQLLEGFAVTGVSITDAASAPRRPGLELTWEPDLPDVRAVMYETRLTATGVVVSSGSTDNVAAGKLVVSDGLVASTAYQTRTKPVCDRPTDWTAWTAATTPAALITAPDIADLAVTEQFQTIALGPFTRDSTPNGTVVATLDMGAVGPGLIWNRGIQFEARLATFVTDDYRIELQRRFRELGRAFTAWEQVSVWQKAGSIAGSDDVWDQRTGEGGVRGTYQDFEYRLIVITRPTSGAGSYQWLRNIYLTVARVTK
ncbi:MAG: phage tail protein [Tabrizicola sp.]|jgi:hypothetical protein|nr:phage tail protein [Tabrizicola sp.]